MKYPYKVGYGMVDEANKPYWNEETHEYLIIVGDEEQTCYNQTINGKPTNYKTSRTVLGHIDLNTGEKYSGNDALMWETTPEEHDTELYKKLFKGGIVYKIRAAMQKGKSVLYSFEIICEIDNQPFLEQLYAAYVEERDRPIYLQTKMFGDLLLDKRYNCFDGAFEFMGHKIEFSISNYDNPSKAVSKLEAFVGNFKSHDEEMRRFAAEKLIFIVNEWADEEGDAHVTEDKFYTHIVPESIEMKSNGRYTVYYTDGGAFDGHSVVVNGNSKGPCNAEITG